MTFAVTNDPVTFRRVVTFVGASYAVRLLRLYNLYRYEWPGTFGTFVAFLCTSDLFRTVVAFVGTSGLSVSNCFGICQ